MQVLEKSLHCLAHPASLVSIGLLILNDHLLKVLVPSWLTGKLSDFAGLFFFPFLLAIGLGVVFQRASLKTIGVLAIGVTTIWFTLIKTTTLGNALTEGMLARLLGMPVQIVLDPTDLLALPVLILTWRLWNRAEAPRPTRLSWIALGVASLATLATSPCPTNARIDRIYYADGILYAHYSVFYSPDLKTAWSHDHYVFSKDLGHAWEYFCDYRTQKCIDIPEAVKSPARLPIVECSRTIPTRCYRIATPDQVEESNDGGRTWQIAWQIPPGRRYYMQRLGEHGICQRVVDPGPYDLILPEIADATTIVAMGTEGVLIRTPEGHWQSRGWGWQKPLPFYAQSLDEAFQVVAHEVDLTVLFALFVLWFLSFHSAQVLKSILVLEQLFAFRRAMPLFIIFVLAGVLIGIWYVSGFWMLGSLWGFSLLGGVWLVGIVFVLIAFRATWQPMTRYVASPAPIWQVAKRVALIALLAAVLPIGMLFLWALGVIAEYAVAALLGLMASAALLVLGYRKVEMWARSLQVRPE